MANSLALLYIARGRDDDALGRFRRFVRAYRAHVPGAEHDLFVVFKGFDDNQKLQEARSVFEGLRYSSISTDDDNFDIGAYRAATSQIEHGLIGLVNSSAEPNCDGWIGKLLSNLGPDVGAVGATGSFESLNALDSSIPSFPNVHLRSNGLIMRREDLLVMFPERIPDKLSAFHVESGPNSFTRQFFKRGMSVLVVGKDGRGLPPARWPECQGFRQGAQSNLLVHDNVTRLFENSAHVVKCALTRGSWGGLASQFEISPN